MYRNYVFDFYGTLADIRTDEDNPRLWEKMSEIYCAMGAEYSPYQLQRAFRRLDRAEKERVASCGSGDRGNVEKAFMGYTGMADADDCNEHRQGNTKNTLRDLQENAEPDLARVFSGLYHEKEILCDAAQAKLTAITFRALSREYLHIYDGVKELLEELRRRGKRIFLLSNAQADFTRPEIKMLGLTQYFDGIFLSSEQGCKKPSPMFFGKLLETYGLKPTESIMIGNDEAADIAGAKRVGMATLYIHTAISPTEYGRVEADYRVMDGDFRKVGGLILQAD